MPKLVHRAPVPEKTAKKILAVVRRGHTIEAAAAVGGVHRDTFYDWMARGRRVGTHEEKPGDKAYRAFYEDVERAKGEAEFMIAETWRKALGGPKAGPGAKDWQAAATWLARRNPKTWAPPSRTEISGPNGGPIPTIDVQRLSDEDLQRVIDGTYMPAATVAA